MEMRTKAQILSAASDLTDTVEVSEDWNPTIRALTDAEFSRAQAMLLSNQKIKADIASGNIGGDIAMDLGTLIEGEFSSRVYICSIGLHDEKWSEKEVRRIPYPGAVKKISDAILGLGEHNLFEGLDQGARQSAERFRKNRRGSEDSRIATDGNPSGVITDGIDNSSESVLGGSISTSEDK